MSTPFLCSDQYLLPHALLLYSKENFYGKSHVLRGQVETLSLIRTVLVATRFATWSKRVGRQDKTPGQQSTAELEMSGNP